MGGYNEVKVCNPLGSKAKKHKLGEFTVLGYISIVMCLTGLAYYCLGNLHPKYRSSLSCIQLLFVTKYSNIEKYGYNLLFQPTVDAVLELEKVQLMLVCTTAQMLLVVNIML